jgi:DNA-binding winged helix-turn-helix (wHTH) protein
MKSAAEIARIIACQEAGWSKRKIATELGISRNTVSRIINRHGAPASCGGKQTQPSTSNNPPDARQPSPVGWQIGPYQLYANGTLILAGIRVAMPSLQERLLVLFTRHANQLLRREEIATELYGRENRQQNVQNNVTLIVHRLRQELARGPLGEAAIRTIHGRGYILVAPVQTLGHTPPSVLFRPHESPVVAINNPFHAEAHDLWPQRDPYKLYRQERLLRKSIDHDPYFEQGYLELCYLQLLQCFWGMRSSIDVRPDLESQLFTLEHLPSKPNGWLGIKAEIQSLLLWQPRTTQQLYGTWLAETLPGGMPRYSWARHLIFSGRPHTAVQLLTPDVRDDLSQGWMNLAMAYCALGDLAAAEEAVHHQLEVDAGMVGTRLFLALLKASQGRTGQATRLIGDSGLLDRPFQGVQALTAYALARGEMSGRSHQLLDQALGLSKEAIAEVGGIGYWGLAALALGRQEEALEFLKLSVKHRCYSAPVLFRTPFLKPHAHTLAVRLFMEAMHRGFAEEP